MKKFITISAHGYIDYVTGTFLSTSPLYLRGLKKDNKNESTEMAVKKPGAVQVVPYTMGVFSTVYSLFTNYKRGIVKKIPIKTHLALDVIGGIFLAASPWLFGFYKRSWVPFVAIGTMEALVALFTNVEEEINQVVRA